MTYLGLAQGRGVPKSIRGANIPSSNPTADCMEFVSGKKGRIVPKVMAKHITQIG